MMMHGFTNFKFKKPMGFENIISRSSVTTCKVSRKPLSVQIHFGLNTHDRSLVFQMGM